MSALPAGHPALRQALSIAIAALLDATSAREVGRWIGRKGDSVTARGDDPDAWPISELRVLADHSREVESAMRAYLLGEERRDGEAVAVVGELLRDVAASGGFVARASAALADGRVNAAEALDLLGEISRRQALENERLIPSLTACLRSEP